MSQLPPNSVALYRVCTAKSIIGFGKYEDMRIGDIMKVDRQYIAWCYFNKEKFSLCKELLEELEITPITKPGAKPEAFIAWDREQAKKYTEEQRRLYFMLKARGKKRMEKAALARARKDASFTKGQLQAINHGRWSGKK